MNRLLKYSPSLLLVIPFFLLTAHVTFAFLDDVLWSLVTGLFGRLMVFGGWLLNIGVNDYVIGFGSNFLTSGVGVAVDSLWVNVRDLFNLTFIFGLVYLGLKMILNSADSQTKRWLIHLILAALLVNFSLFITKFVVDMSNILATQITSGFSAQMANGVPVVINGVTQIGVADSFMDALGVQSTFTGNSQALSDMAAGGSPYGYIFGTAFLFIIGAFVFGAGGILLMIRYAVLLIYMILSPLMFLGWVFPGLQSVSTKYWRGFLSRAFFAPIYILMLYFANSILTGFFQGGSGNSNFADSLAAKGIAGQQAFTSSFPPFIIACVFLIAALVIAQKMGADGASHAVSMGRNLTNRAKRGVQRGAKWTGRKAERGLTAAPRYGMKRGANYLGNKTNQQINKWQRGQGSKVGQKLASTVVFDDAARKAAGKMKGAKMGFANTVDETLAKKNVITERSDRNRERVESQAKYAATSALAEKRAAKNEIGAKVKRMSDQEKLGLSLQELQSGEVAAHLTDADIKMIQDSGRYNNEQMKLVKEARDEGTFAEDFAALNKVDATADELNDAFENLSKTMQSLSNERLTGMNKDKLENSQVAMNLSEKQLTTLQESGKYDTATMDNIRTARTKGLKAMATGDYVGAGLTSPEMKIAQESDQNHDEYKTVIKERQEKLMNRSTQQAGELPVEVFKEEKMAQHITPQALEQRMKNGSVSDDDMKEIQTNISNHLEQNEADRKKWDKWVDKSTIGAGFDFGSSQTNNTSPGGIATDQNVAAARRDRDDTAWRGMEY